MSPRRRRPAIGLACHVALLAVALVAASAPSRAVAHDRRLGRLAVVATDEGAVLDVELRALDVTAVLASRGASGGASLGPFLQRHLRVTRGGRPCALEARSAGAPSALGATPYVRTRLRALCPARGPLRVTSRVHETLVGYAFFAQLDDGANHAEGMLAEGADTLPRSRARGLPFVAALTLGATHLATGADHLAFLLVLLLSTRGMLDALRAITGFTVGHALSLGLVATGRLHADPVAAEVLIAASVAWAALGLGRDEAKRVVGRSELVRVGVVAGGLLLASLAAFGPLDEGAVAIAVGAGVFAAASHATDDSMRGFVATLAVGLVHGLGFAGALVEHGGGPPSLPTLLGFNLGLEAMQLLLAAAVLPVWAWLRRSASRASAVRLLVATGVAATAGAWWVERLPRVG